jgi:hypothetical protein
MCAGIRFVGFNRTGKTALGEGFWFVLMFHCWPFAFLITSRA